MSNDFEKEVDSIVGAHNAEVEKTRNQATSQHAAMQEFLDAWSARCAQVVVPALRQIEATLKQRHVQAIVETSPPGSAALIVERPQGPSTVRDRKNAPRVVVSPNQSTKRIDVRLANVSVANEGTYPVDQLDAAVLERHTLVLIRALYGGA
jgi:hypothetical protein